MLGSWWWKVQKSGFGGLSHDAGVSVKLSYAGPLDYCPANKAEVYAEF